MRVVYVDIDNTLCTSVVDGDYESIIVTAHNQKVIDRVNKFFDDGYRVVIWTARGTVTGVDWKELTKEQLRQWGVKYHELKFGKPQYDIIIDDKAVNPEDMCR